MTNEEVIELLQSIKWNIESKALQEPPHRHLYSDDKSFNTGLVIAIEIVSNKIEEIKSKKNDFSLK